MSLQKQEICLLSEHFALFVANNVKMTFRSTKKLACLALYSGKLLLNTLIYFSVSGCGSSALHILLNASFFLMVCAKRQ